MHILACHLFVLHPLRKCSPRIACAQSQTLLSRCAALHPRCAQYIPFLTAQVVAEALAAPFSPSPFDLPAHRNPVPYRDGQGSKYDVWHTSFTVQRHVCFFLPFANCKHLADFGVGCARLPPPCDSCYSGRREGHQSTMIINRKLLACGEEDSNATSLELALYQAMGFGG